MTQQIDPEVSVAIAEQAWKEEHNRFRSFIPLNQATETTRKFKTELAQSWVNTINAAGFVIIPTETYSLLTAHPTPDRAAVEKAVRPIVDMGRFEIDPDRQRLTSEIASAVMLLLNGESPDER